MINTNKILIGLSGLVVVLILAVVWMAKAMRDINANDAAFKQAMTNQFKTFTDKNGNLVAQVNAAVFSNADDFKAAVKQLNAQGANILSKVDNNTQGLILLSKKVGGVISGGTTIAGIDTEYQVSSSKNQDSIKKKDTVMKLYPTYAINDTANRFYSITGTVGFKGFTLKPMFSDSTELKLEPLGNGFFKRKVLAVQSINKNPFSKTTGLKYLVVEKKPAPFWAWLEGIGVLVAGFFLGSKL